MVRCPYEALPARISNSVKRCMDSHEAQRREGGDIQAYPQASLLKNLTRCMLILMMQDAVAFYAADIPDMAFSKPSRSGKAGQL